MHLAALGLLIAVEAGYVATIIIDVLWDTYFYLIMMIVNAIWMKIIDEEPTATST